MVNLICLVLINRIPFLKANTSLDFIFLIIFLLNCDPILVVLYTSVTDTSRFVQKRYIISVTYDADQQYVSNSSTICLIPNLAAFSDIFRHDSCYFPSFVFSLIMIIIIIIYNNNNKILIIILLLFPFLLFSINNNNNTNNNNSNNNYHYYYL